MNYYGIFDCNNFYVSCERVFNPALNNVPVAVLSNNDGCIIARSAEVKALGVPMGAPIFKWRALLEKHNAHIFSSNFTLYGDMSARIMSIICETMQYTQIYSVDEAFVLFKQTSLPEACKQATDLQLKLYQWTGVPVSVGIAPTKTLAKVANQYAKKYPSLNGIFAFEDSQDRSFLLENLNIEDTWGIGRRYAKKLNTFGVCTAHDLIKKNDAWIQQQLTICGLKTVHELRGTVCFPLESKHEPHKAIACTRSFGKPITELSELKEAVATYVARAAEKARKQGSAVISLYIFIRTSRFTETQYANSANVTLATPSTYTPDLIKAALKTLTHIFKPGIAYKKAGVIFTQLIDQRNLQENIFKPDETAIRHMKNTTMHTVDKTNRKWGRNALRFAAQGLNQKWAAKHENTSPRYTTSWYELLRIKA